jgi:L-lactate dehydrogenase complex protein LldG
MNARETILRSIRRALAVGGGEAPRRDAVAERLRRHPSGVIPARGQLGAKERIDLFARMLEAAAGTMARIKDAADVPGAIAALLRANNLPLAVRRGADPRLAALPWEREGALTVGTGPSRGDDLVAVSHAFAGVAESGTLLLVSGPDNPTTLNFLPDLHVVLLAAADIVGDYEAAWGRVRERFGNALPRTVNMITGPSRSADIEQTLILGAHGPRQLHVIVVGEVPD